MGSVFSPYYAWARRRGAADPDNHCTLNVAIYSPTQHWWTMTERGRDHCQRDAREFVIGPSAIIWDGQSLRIRVRERSVPWARRIEGEIRVWPEQLFCFSTALDAQGRHRWGPLAPSARIDVNLKSPDLQWTGTAYIDSNEGDEPIASGIHTWNWSRARRPDGSTLVFYDLQWPDQPDRLLTLNFTPEGAVESLPPAPAQPLSSTGWRIARRMRSEGPVVVQEQLEDTPFYQRSLLGFDYAGESLLGFHETLSVPRLRSPIVQAMLPWRMPRRA